MIAERVRAAMRAVTFSESALRRLHVIVPNEVTHPHESLDRVLFVVLFYRLADLMQNTKETNSLQ